MQLLVLEVLMFHHNANLIPPGDSFDHSIVNDHPTDGITLFLVWIFIGNKLFGWRYCNRTKH